MSTTPTSALTFNDLILAVAIKSGVAYYGAGGNSAPAIPTDAVDLANCKRIVNDGIRMFIADAPQTGWRWTRPVASVTLWLTLAASASRTITFGAYDSTNDQTAITVNTAVLYDSMEEKTINVVTGSATCRIKTVSTTTTGFVYGDKTALTDGSQYSITADGDYTLGKHFAGSYTGQITFAAGTNRGNRISWVDAASLREYRQDVSSDSGTPCEAAVDLLTDVRRRYRLMVAPQPGEQVTVEFPFDLSFTLLTAVTDVPPSPLVHDEAIRAACLAVVERDVDDAPDGPLTQYYRSIALPNSHAADARSGPRRLGYFGSGSAPVRDRDIRSTLSRPDVTYTP